VTQHDLTTTMEDVFCFLCLFLIHWEKTCNPTYTRGCDEKNLF